MRNYLIIAAWLLVLVLIGSIVRLVLLGKNTVKLDSISSAFPRDYYVGRPGDQPLTYVALGDSTIQGTGAPTVADSLPHLIATRLAAKGQYVHVINLGISGARTADVLQDQLPQVAKLKPDAITLNIGANDATHLTPYDAYETDLHELLAGLLATSAKQVLVATTPDMGGIPALPLPYGIVSARRAAHQNQLLAKYVDSPRLIIIDLFKNGKLPDLNLYAPDLFHPNAAGYAHWAALYP